MIALDELDGFMETLHLFRSPPNRTKLEQAVEDSRNESPMGVDALRKEVGLECFFVRISLQSSISR